MASVLTPSEGVSKQDRYIMIQKSNYISAKNTGGMDLATTEMKVQMKHQCLT